MSKKIEPFDVTQWQEQEQKVWPTETVKERSALMTERVLQIMEELGYPRSLQVQGAATDLQALAEFHEINTAFLLVRGIVDKGIEEFARQHGSKVAWETFGRPDWDTWYSSLILWMRSNA
jgi:hypothetical protein